MSATFVVEEIEQLQQTWQELEAQTVLLREEVAAYIAMRSTIADRFGVRLPHDCERLRHRYHELVLCGIDSRGVRLRGANGAGVTLPWQWLTDPAAYTIAEAERIAQREQRWHADASEREQARLQQLLERYGTP